MSAVLALATRYATAGRHFSVRQYRSNGLESVVISTVPTVRPDILMVGHLDVVPAPARQFTPVMHGHHLTARGSWDMKGVVAVILAALHHADPPAGTSLAVMLTIDEEQGGFDGARYLVEAKRYRPGVALVPDSGLNPGNIVLANKGVVHATIRIRGRSAHAAQPWNGLNAVASVGPLVAALQRAWPDPVGLDDWRTSLTVTGIHGGEAINQVPAETSLAVDIRFTERTDARRVVRRLKRVVAPHHVEGTIFESAAVTPRSHPAVRRYAQAIKAVTGQEATFSKWPGANDGRFFSNRGIPVLTSRPRGGDAHGPSEWIDLRSQEQLYRIYQEFIGSYGTAKN